MQMTLYFISLRKLLYLVILQKEESVIPNPILYSFSNLV